MKQCFGSKQSLTLQCGTSMFNVYVLVAINRMTGCDAQFYFKSQK